MPSGLIQASDGNFYGNVRRFGPLCGAAYRLTPAGQFTVLKHFPQPSECFPIGELVQASNGLLYGDTFYGEEFQISLSGVYRALGIVIPNGGLKPGPTGLAQASDGNLWVRPWSIEIISRVLSSHSALLAAWFWRLTLIARQTSCSRVPTESSTEPRGRATTTKVTFLP